MAVGGGMLMAATGLAAVSWWDRRGAVEAVEAEVEADQNRPVTAGTIKEPCKRFLHDGRVGNINTKASAFRDAVQRSQVGRASRGHVHRQSHGLSALGKTARQRSTVQLDLEKL